jgi:hypothetical protein
MIDERSNELYVNVSMDDFPLKKHNLIQAMLAVNDIFYTVSLHVVSLFLKDVKSWVDSNDVRYTENINFKGKSGFDRKFDFVIPKSRILHERLIEVVNDLNKTTTDSLIMDWTDIRETRSEKSKAFVFANGVKKIINPNFLNAFKHLKLIK